MNPRLFKMPAQTTMLPAIDEAEWQRQIIDLARLLGWRVAHFRAAKTNQGWRTPVAADGKGFPDLICVRERVVAIELKSATGKTSSEQDAWLAAFERAGIEAYVWRPYDLETAMETLRRRTA